MTNRQFQWTGNGHSQLPLAELGKPSPNIDLHPPLFDLDLWPTTLTYNPRLAKVKVDPHAKNQGQRSNCSNRRAPQTNGRTHTDATKRIISPATRSIKIAVLYSAQWHSKRINNGDDPNCTSCRNLVGFRFVTLEFTRLNCVQQASISTPDNLTAFTRGDGDTALAGWLYARLCHAFIVISRWQRCTMERQLRWPCFEDCSLAVTMAA